MNNLPILKQDSYIKETYDFWKNYRIILTKMLNEKEKKLEKTPENIVELAQRIGVKACARYFNIEPSQVRYYRNKIGC